MRIVKNKIKTEHFKLDEILKKLQEGSTL